MERPPSPPSRRAAPRAQALDVESEPAKRREILHAAVRVFAASGYHGCRIADIAREAGVAYGLVYHYFANKEALLESVLEEQWTLLLESLRACAAGPGAAPERLASMCRFAIDVFRTAPAAVRVLLLEMARTPAALGGDRVQGTFAEAIAIVAGVVRRGIEAGELRAGADPKIAAASLLGALELTLTGMVLGVLEAGETDTDAVAQSIVDLILSGLLPR